MIACVCVHCTSWQSEKENMPSLNLCMLNYLHALSILRGDSKTRTLHRPSYVCRSMCALLLLLLALLLLLLALSARLLMRSLESLLGVLMILASSSNTVPVIQSIYKFL